MKNEDLWEPSRFIHRNGWLRSSFDTDEVGIGSRLITDLAAGFYERALPLYAKGSLADLGCGKVPLYRTYKHLVTEITCVDWEIDSREGGHIDFVCDLTRRLPFDGASFDTIILSDVLEHIPGPEHLWREMARVLRPAGHLIMNVPFYYWIHAAPHDYYRYTEYGLTYLVEASGLSVVELKPLGGLPEVFLDLLGKAVAPMPIMGPLAAAAVQTIGRAGIKTAVGRKLSERTAKQFPLGYSLVAMRPARSDSDVR